MDRAGLAERSASSRDASGDKNLAGAGQARVMSAPEASGCLVAPPVFKTGGRRFASSAGSIPVRLRHDPAVLWHVAPSPDDRRGCSSATISLLNARGGGASDGRAGKRDGSRGEKARVGYFQAPDETHAKGDDERDPDGKRGQTAVQAARRAC